MSRLGDFIKSADFKNEKHVPVIELPSAVSAGQPVQVTVSVGKEIAHPNTTEHFISWIKLFYKDEGGAAVYEIGKAEFSAHGASAGGANSGPAYTNPIAIFNVKLDKPGILIAESYCNIHGLWESSQEISF